MKITALLIVLGIMNVMASDSYSQKARITLNMADASLEEVLDEIEKQSEFYFLFNQKLIDTNRKIQLNVKNQKISKILNILFDDTKVNYVVFDRQIVLTTTAIDDVALELDQSFSKRHKSLRKANNSNESIRKLEKIISGKVTDASDDSPLIGASILEKGTTNGTVTDADGVYKLSVPDEATTIIISYIGFETEEGEIGSRSVINFALVPDLKQLEEIIVVGYGSVKKSDLTGSVASVSAEELTAYPALDAVQALQGRAAGVSIQATNGEPGSSYKIQIRGSTSINASSNPLIVVDGLVGGTMPPPEDIQSVEILKDASSTAIYGSRGANGVIMVTTKKGKAGETQINFSSSWSSQKEINRLELLNADQFTNYIQEIDSTYVPELTGKGTDWQDEIFREGGIQNYQLSVAGGSDKVRYYLSGTIFNQKGVIEESRYKRYSVTSNIEVDASEILKFGASLFARKTEQNGTRTQETGYFQPGVVSSAYKFMPTQGLYDADGNFSVADRGDPSDNPYALATQLKNEVVQDLFQGSLYGEINIIEGLKFRTSVGANTSNRRTGTHYPTTINRGAAANGEAWLGFSRNTQFLIENYLTYTTTIAETHELNVVGGYSYQSFLNERINVQTTGYTSDVFTWWNIQDSSNPPIIRSESNFNDISSFYARLNYSINGKYLFTFNARRDGASVFAENNKWAFFPSGAFAWNISDESFLSNSELISLLKLRASYGQTGNQGIRPYESLPAFTGVTATVQGNEIPALRPSNIGNSELKWETTTQTDIGIDLEMFQGRFGVTMDYYVMNTTDLLFDLPLPLYGGVPSQLVNIGTMENKGFEFTVNADILTGGLKWNSNANISFNNNKITKLAENLLDGNDIYYSSWPLPGSVQTQVLREGESIGSFWGYEYEGVSQAGDSILINGEGVGGESFKDQNGDGILDDDDRTLIGSPQPKFIWGWNNDFSFKGFSLNIFIQGSEGGKMINYSLMELGIMNGRTNVTTEALNRWTPTNTNTDIPMANAARISVMSDRWVEDASYVRLKNISLGYTFPESLVNKIKMKSARVYISGQNLLTFTGYKGLDPEVAYRDSNRNLGLDYGSYPNVKSYTVGLNIGF